MKLKLTTVATLLTLVLSCQLYAQEGPMPSIYVADFENVSKDTYEREELTINGRRWLFVNARVISDPLRWIPQGKKAVEIRASEDVANPSRIELLDPIKGAKISCEMVMSGQDTHFGRKGWKLEISYDGGKNWIGKELSFDITPTANAEDAPDPEKEFVFRYVYTGNPDILGSGQRILIDNICVTDPEDIEVPANLRPGFLTDGYRTSSTTVSFIPVIRGTWWTLGDPQEEDPFGNSYIQVQLDNQEPIVVSAINEETKVTFENLSPGKHTVKMQLMDIKTKKPFTTFDVKNSTEIFVDPYTPIEGLANLRKAKVGAFYEVTNAADKNGKTLPIYANYLLHVRAQKWLYDTQSGILLDDPFRYNYVRQTTPDKAVIIKKMRGRLVEMDNNLCFLLDMPIEFAENVDEKYEFKNGIVDDLSLLNNNPQQYAGFPVALRGMRFKQMIDADPKKDISVTPNVRYEILDRDGHSVVLQNLYSYKLRENKCNTLLPGFVDIFGLTGFSFPENKVTVFPVFFVENKDLSATEVIGNGQDLRIIPSTEGLQIAVNQPSKLFIYDVRGQIVCQMDIAVGLTTVPFAANKGIYIAKTIGSNGKTQILKFQSR